METRKRTPHIKAVSFKHLNFTLSLIHKTCSTALFYAPISHPAKALRDLSILRRGERVLFSDCNLPSLPRPCLPKPFSSYPTLNSSPPLSSFPKLFSADILG